MDEFSVDHASTFANLPGIPISPSYPAPNAARVLNEAYYAGRANNRIKALWLEGKRGHLSRKGLRQQGVEGGLSFGGGGGVPPSGVRAEGVGFAVGALQGPHGGRDQEVIGELQ